MDLHVCLLATRPLEHRREWFCGWIKIATKRLKVMTHRRPPTTRRVADEKSCLTKHEPEFTLDLCPMNSEKSDRKVREPTRLGF